MKELLFALVLTIGTTAPAREWRDTKGRSFHGVLLGVEFGEVTFQKYGEGRFTVPIAMNSAADRDYIKRWTAARSSAVVLSVTVFQATKRGALVSGSQLVHEVAMRDVPVIYSPLDRKMATERKLAAEWKRSALPTEHVFIEGLDDVLDTWEIGFLVVWPAGVHDYATAGGAARRVAKYTVNPPGP